MGRHCPNSTASYRINSLVTRALPLVSLWLTGQAVFAQVPEPAPGNLAPGEQAEALLGDLAEALNPSHHGPGAISVFLRSRVGMEPASPRRYDAALPVNRTRTGEY